MFGDGLCACHAAEGRGWWAGAVCDECRPDYFGPGCDRACPAAGGWVCAGHGVCDDGRAGGGRCACYAAYAGPACELLCPIAAGAVCNGHGACARDTALCNCSARWAGPACGGCAHGWVGAQCAIPCPEAAAGGVCSDRGVCAPVAGGAEATCECRAGYAGLACELECPGGARALCGGHGACVWHRENASVACACSGSAAAGYWAGAECQACRSGWSGPQCAQPCPRNAAGVPCSGRPCAAGVCACGAGECGAGCNMTGAQCSAVTCPEGFYGAGCALACPGAGACSGHGWCVSTVAGPSAGRCLCAVGYTGPGCEVGCPGRANGTVCSGHGSCEGGQSACNCYPYFASPNCSVACPVAGGQVCAGHGTCADGAAGDGGCACDAGYATADCGTRCPGYRPGDNATGVCGGHGRCLPDATCACTRADGHWAGVACRDCAPGFFGADCRRFCGHGVTDGQVRGARGWVMRSRVAGSGLDGDCDEGTDGGTVRGGWTAQTVKRPRQQPAHPQYANYWAPLTRKRHTMPHSAQPQHTNCWALRTRKRHQQEHRPQRPTERSDPTQHAKGRTGDCSGPRKGATTRRNVTQGAKVCALKDLNQGRLEKDS